MAARKPVERLTFLVGAPPPPVSGPAHARPLAPPLPEPLSEVDVSPALLRRAQARARRASLIGEQLGDPTPPFYFVDFMAVEDLAVTVGLDAAVAAIAERDERTVEAVMDSWQQAVERIASDERCRFVDSLRPYVERIERELEGEDLVAAE
ncbi:MAG: hypothetical protein QOH15_417 [Gaiellales bacterium]|jgi:hypothetical protein|nr:hypothetical protein [Gaiellales bacterium]